MALDPTTPFVWGAGGAPMTPQAAEAQRKVAQALLMQGADYSPVRSPWQGAARVAQALVGGYESAQADASDRKLAEMQPQMLAAALTGAIPGSSSQPVASGTAAPMGATSIPSGEIDPRLSSAISTAASSSGVDPAYMTRLAMVENGGKVEGGSPLSSAQGPFQFLSGTAKQYGLANPNDPAASADAAARLTLDNKTALTNALGREPTPGELYLAHQQGAGGAIKLLQNPNAPVESVIGAQAARNNAATPGMTAGQFANKWMGKFGDIAQTVDPNQKNIIDAQADSPAAPMAFADTQPPAGAAPSQAAQNPAAVPAATQPAQSASMAKIAPLISLASSPYASPATKQIAGVLLSSQLSAIQKANDPMTALDRQSKILAIKKAQQDLDGQGKFAVIGEDNMGRKQYGFVDSTSGTVTPYAPQGNQPTPDSDLSSLHGEDFFTALNKSDPAIATQVRAVVEGRAPYPTGMILKTPYGQRLAQMVTQADPSFETGNATSRVKVRNEFKAGGVGSPAGQISAGNTALQHAGEMSDALERMKSPDSEGVLGAVGESGIPFMSYYANKLHNAAVQGTPEGKAYNDFMTAKNHFSEEVTKFYAGSAGSEAERARALANLDAAKSLPELRSAIKTEANLMQGKVNALQERWRNGMGPLVPNFPLISKESQAAVDRIMQRDQTSQTPSNAPKTTSAPVKEGATIVNPKTGERRILQGGKWVPLT